MIARPRHRGRRLRLRSLADDDIRPITEASERFEVVDLLPDSHPTLDQVALVLFVEAEEDDITSHSNTPPRWWSTNAPGRNRGTEVGILTEIHNIVVNLLIGTKDT